uniref:Uncharacterized protein n=1 Tax=Caenorhabditis tropicalis TaxID=1561998 RepID=A0A1I7U7R0_9PELO
MARVLGCHLDWVSCQFHNGKRRIFILGTLITDMANQLEPAHHANDNETLLRKNVQLESQSSKCTRANTKLKKDRNDKEDLINECKECIGIIKNEISSIPDATGSSKKRNCMALIGTKSWKTPKLFGAIFSSAFFIPALVTSVCTILYCLKQLNNTSPEQHFATIFIACSSVLGFPSAFGVYIWWTQRQQLFYKIWCTVSLSVSLFSED